MMRWFQLPPVDLGEDTPYGKVAVGAVLFILGLAWKAVTWGREELRSIAAALDKKANRESVDARFRELSTALEGRARVEDVRSAQDAVKELQQSFETWRLELSVQHGEYMTSQEMIRNELGQRIDKSARDLEQQLSKQTLDLTNAIFANRRNTAAGDGAR